MKHVCVLTGTDCMTAVLCVLPFYFMHLLRIVKLFCICECLLSVVIIVWEIVCVYV